MKKIVILIAVYNGEAYFKAQLKSIINQTLKAKKIVISDDNSSDRTFKSLSDAENFKNVSIVRHKKNFGSGAANFINTLKNLDLKDYDFVSLSDQDDIWKLDKLEIAVQKLEQGYDGYSSNVEAFWADGKRKVLVKNQPQQNFDHLFESAGPGCTFVLSKKLALKLQQFLKNGYFNKLHNYHDWLIYAFARSHNLKWYIDTYPSVEYRQHDTNVFGANVGIKAFISRTKRVLSGEGVDFAFRLMRELKVQDPFIQSLFPLCRLNLLRLAFKAKQCRRRARDQIYFFFACILLAIVFPKKLRII